MKRYFPNEIEPKWQKIWQEEGFYQAKDFDKKQKYYVLIEFPYPSGAGLHVGHVRSWTAMDAYSRKKRMEGFNVLYPIGWDAFGLPAENYAIKNHINPSVAVKQNIVTFKKQCQSLGLSFDWSREVNTTDPKYYKWTQWIFLKLFEKGMAYQADVAVNWCPFCKTNLADEEVLADGTHERCGNQTEKRMQKQWLLRITRYAEKLLEGLKTVDYPDKVRIQQENWIGRSEGTQIEFKVENSNLKIPVFTTRVDTVFSGTFLILAPEHPLVSKITTKEQKDKVERYVKETVSKSEIDRTNLEKEKTGVFTGALAINPVNQETMPVWISDFVLFNYGTGAVFADAHDQRDFEMAKKYGLPLKVSIKPEDDELWEKVKELEECFEGDGILVNSGEFDGQTSKEARKNITKWLEKHNLGSVSVQYKMRDWVFSRQHYWGEPIPVVHCQKCGVVAVPEKDLPVELPYLEAYEPTGTGESPLAKVGTWVNVSCPKCKGEAKRETDTMPNWAGSNWYYLAYLFANKLGNQKSKIKNQKSGDIFSENQDLLKYWMPIDIYQGGFEHTTLHLLYSRFIYRFLSDINAVPTKEPYAKRRVHGIVLGTDGRKMSKSFDNVINPDDIVKEYGADTLRLYEMFMGPFDQTIAWNSEGVEGCFRFLKRVWQLVEEKVSEGKTSKELLSSLHATVKKVSEDFEELKFNTAIAAMMAFINDWQKDEKGLGREDLGTFLRLLAPFAPHIAEELWQTVNPIDKNMSETGPVSLFPRPMSSVDRLPAGTRRGSPALTTRFDSVHSQTWPEFDKVQLVKDLVTIPVQVNGKLRDIIEIENAKVKMQNEVEEKATKSAKVQKYLDGKKIKKVIYVEGRLINFVVGA